MNQALCTASGMVKLRMNDESLGKGSAADQSRRIGRLPSHLPCGARRRVRKLYFGTASTRGLAGLQEGGLILGIPDLVDRSVTVSQSLHH